MPRPGVLAILLSLWVMPDIARTAEPFRVCLDPANPPLSMAEGERHGIYYEIAERLAARMERPLDVVWWPTDIGKRAIRLKLLSGECRAMFGVPFVQGLMGPKLQVAGPLLDLGYALVFRAERELASIDDLRGLRVAVVFNTPAQNALATLEGVESVTVREPEQALDRLLGGEVDAAFVWDVVAGWYDRTRAKGRLHVVAVEGPRLRWQSAIGVPRKADALRERLQLLLGEMRDVIDYVAKTYGYGHDARIAWRWLETGALEGEEGQKRGRRSGSSADGARKAGREEREVLPAILEAEVRDGRRLFDAVLGCAHCHGPSAAAPDRARDLRLMRRRYGERWSDVYWKTVMEGRTVTRSGLVMPAWADAASRAQLEAIRRFLATLQE